MVRYGIESLFFSFSLSLCLFVSFFLLLKHEFIVCKKQRTTVLGEGYINIRYAVSWRSEKYWRKVLNRTVTQIHRNYASMFGVFTDELVSVIVSNKSSWDLLISVGGLCFWKFGWFYLGVYILIYIPSLSLQIKKKREVCLQLSVSQVETHLEHGCWVLVNFFEDLWSSPQKYLGI